MFAWRSSPSVPARKQTWRWVKGYHLPTKASAEGGRDEDPLPSRPLADETTGPITSFKRRAKADGLWTPDAGLWTTDRGLRRMMGLSALGLMRQVGEGSIIDSSIIIRYSVSVFP
jgi:hypothetical protein